MKKIGRLVLILALVLTLLPCAAWGESKEEYGTAIQNALDSLADAFSGGNRAAVQSAILAVREPVYNAIRYLASIGEYDARCLSILDCAVAAVSNWSTGSSYSENMRQAYEANQAVFFEGANNNPYSPYYNPHNNNHYVSLSPDSAVLSGPGYTGIELYISQNCDRWGGSVYAGTLQRNNCEIPVKVYSDNVPGQGGNGDEFDLDYAGDVVIYAYIDEADYNAASPGTYTGSLSYGLWGMDGGDGHVYSVRGGGDIELTLVKPADPVEYVVTAEASPAGGGTVTGTGSCLPDTPITLTAVPAEHFRFVNWTENGSVVSAEAGYTFTPAADSHLVAHFEQTEYRIITRNCFVTLGGDDPTNPLTYAEPGTRLFIWWDYENPPEGMYCTGDFSVDGYILPPLEYEFTMPEGDVTAAVVYMPQETLTVDLSAGPVLVPGFALYPCGDMEWNDPDEFSYYLMDLNGDGTFDLKVVPEEDGDMLVSPLSGMLALSPSVTKDISEEHEIYGTVVFRFTPPAFDDLAGAGSLLTLPADLETVEESAFEGDTAFTAVDAGHCMVIGAKAFKGCAGLKAIRLPGECTIDEHAFDGCTSLYAVYGPEGSETQAWAEAHHLLFIGE